MKVRVLVLSVVFCLLSVVFVACNDGEVNSKYSNLPARLHIEYVSWAPTLFTACESMGEFCTIRLSSDGQQILCKDATDHSPDPINITAIAAYGSFSLGLSGFIVGHLSIAEMGDNEPRVVCYDLACSNCYQDYKFTKPLVLQVGGYAKCNSCGRTYNLNDIGNISDGPAGRPLYRYRVSYLNPALLIYNG